MSPSEPQIETTESPLPGGGEADASAESESHARPLRHLRLPRLRPLSVGVRITLHVLGWLLVVIGLAGFFLPVIPGGIALAGGLAVLSVASRRLHQWLRPKFRRWPRGWRRLERFRRRLHRRLEPKD